MSAPLDSRQLRAFRVLARTGSFTQTARELQLTQSGISHSMKALETEIGCRILDRLGKKVVLTQAGEQLLHHAEKILQEMASARESLQQLDQGGRGRLRIGASISACQHIIPPVLRQFKERFPHHELSLEPANTAELVAALVNRRLDLALALEPENEPQLEFHPLFTDELYFITSPAHPWAQAGRVERSTIPHENHIFASKQNLTFRLIDHYFRRENIVLNATREAGSVEAAKELVKLGLGVGILAPWMAQKELAEGSLVALPLGRKKLQRRWGILQLRGRLLSPAEESFIGLCKSASAAITQVTDQNVACHQPPSNGHNINQQEPAKQPQPGFRIQS